MERLTNELMQLVQMESEGLGELYPIALAETLRDSVELVRAKAAEKEMTMLLDVDEEIIVEADEEKMRQILINLLENAIRYSGRGTSIRLKAVMEGHEAVIQVEDSGIGIPREDLPRITERFYRVNKARSRADGGSGLGLSIVDQLVGQHHGTLHIESELGKGTTVTVRLPLMEG